MVFQDGDLVRLIRQPKNQHAQVQGEVGYIELDPKHSGYVTVHTLHEDGRSKGMGSVPTDCVEACNEGEWLVALLANQEILKNAEDTVIKWNSDLLDAKIRVAEKSGLPVDVVMEVLELWDKEKPHNPYDR